MLHDLFSSPSGKWLCIRASCCIPMWHFLNPIFDSNSWMMISCILCKLYLECCRNGCWSWLATYDLHVFKCILYNLNVYFVTYIFSCVYFMTYMYFSTCFTYSLIPSINLPIWMCWNYQFGCTMNKMKVTPLCNFTLFNTHNIERGGELVFYITS